MECNARKGQEKRVRFEESNASDYCKDPTVLIAEDATTTREGSEDNIDEMNEDEAKNILLNHPLPKARQRTNIVSDDYIPEERLFGAYTIRDGPCADDHEGFLSAQVNCGFTLPVHKDNNNHGETWLMGLGDYSGGRLWTENL